MIRCAFWEHTANDLRNKWQMCVIAILFVVVVSGCTYVDNRKDSEAAMGAVIPVKGREGTKHFIIIGFGIVRVNRPEGETAALVTDTQALGINVSDQPGLKIGVGYSSCTVTTVPDSTGADDIRVEVTRKPVGALKITTHSAKLENSSAKGGIENGEK